MLGTDPTAVNPPFQPVPDLVKLSGNQPLIQPRFECFVWNIFYFDIDC
jgi:hypothetical protein